MDFTVPILVDRHAFKTVQNVYKINTNVYKFVPENFRAVENPLGDSRPIQAEVSRERVSHLAFIMGCQPRLLAVEPVAMALDFGSEYG